MFDMKKCRPGDRLITVHGLLLEYVKHRPNDIFPHLVEYTDGSKGQGTRTDEGFVFRKKRLPEDEDIVCFHLGGGKEKMRCSCSKHSELEAVEAITEHDMFGEKLTYMEQQYRCPSCEEKVYTPDMVFENMRRLQAKIYWRLQLRWIDLNHVEEGVRVKVFREPMVTENQFSTIAWTEQKKGMLGKEYEVSGIAEGGIYLYDVESQVDVIFPYFVLSILSRT